jgi:hypothetical protein
MIMLGRKNGMLYEVDAGSSVLDLQHTALIASNGPAKLSIAESRMWHRRLGHPGEAAIKSIVSGYVDDGNVCEVCIQAKLRRKIVRIPVQRTTTPFELVHSDLCGPFAVRSSGGAQYFIVYIDDHSRHTEIAVLPDKRAETCTAAFQWFQAKIDSWGYDIRRFRSDNGSGEYNNKMFRSILAARGIAFEPCPPHAAQERHCGKDDWGSDSEGQGNDARFPSPHVLLGRSYQYYMLQTATRTPDANSQRASTTRTPDVNSQRVSTSPPDANSQRVSTAIEPMPIFMNGSLRLNKALYGLKQAPLLWHATINEFLLSIGCTRAHADENLYLRSGVFLLLYVDDTQILYPPSASEAAADLKAALKKEYKMTDLGKAKQFLGVEIERQDSGAITLGQAKYIQTILKPFGMEDANTAPTPLHDKTTLEAEPEGESEVDASY